MEAWMGWTLFAILLAAIAMGVAGALRRAREVRETARELGMTYQSHDDTLAGELAGKLPMFAHDEIRCSDITSYQTLFGICHLFRFSYVRLNAAGRRDRESVGLIACLRSNGPVDEKIKPQLAAAASEHWEIEHEGEWLAMRRRSDKGDDGYSGKQLRDYHSDVQRLLAMVFGAMKSG